MRFLIIMVLPFLLLGMRMGFAQQVLYGRVIDDATRQPISGVHVFVAHTTIGAFTGENALKSRLALENNSLVREPELLLEYGYWSVEGVADFLPRDYSSAAPSKNRVPAQSPQDEPPPKRNGFVLSDLLIPLEEIHSGGPPRDGIPSIDRPIFTSANAGDFLRDDDRVIGIRRNGVAKAYPIRIMNYHEIVNDDFDGEPVVVTYCPLCGSGMAFLSEVDQSKRTFGVSGLLYNSDVLLYDRETESLWSQILAKAISGPSSGQTLAFIPTRLTTWRRWREENPATLVLTSQTGYARDYSRTPYEGYEDSPQIWFPVAHQSSKLHEKTLVAGIEIEGKFKAYPLRRLARARSESIADEFNGKKLTIHYDREGQSVRIFTEDGQEWPVVTLFWFAWYAFHPDTEVYKR